VRAKASRSRTSTSAGKVRHRERSVARLAPEDAALREFISDFSAASALIRQLRRRLADTLGLSVAEHSVMLGLWYCQRRAHTRVRDLAEHLHVAAAHVTAELGKLERAGFVVKRKNNLDRREAEVQLTDKGHALLNRLAPLLREVNESLFANVNYRDMRTAQRFFRLVIAQASEAIRTADLYAIKQKTD
jgi:MarR family transcriptional regulator, organic hydroperoxide resistance regulator